MSKFSIISAIDNKITICYNFTVSKYQQKTEVCMKKGILSLVLLLVLSLSLASCQFNLNTGNGSGDKGNENENENGNENENENGEEEKANLIYDNDSELYLILDSFTQAQSNVVSDILSSIDQYKDIDALTKFAAADSEPHKHEIVIGNTDRQISKDAMRRLERMDKNQDTDVRYVIYSDGASVAIVFDEDDSTIGLKSAIDDFINNFVGEELVLPPSAVAEEVVDVFAYLEKTDAEYNETIWQAMANKVGGETGVRLVEAMKQLYSLYTNDQVLWLANLYEPSICVCNGLYGESECSGTKYCGTSAFYYSNSARDTVGYLPDVESTFQAVGLLESTGVARTSGSVWYNLLDKEMKDGILAFVRAIQREDGYFVHPQWTSPGTSRISRDLNWSVGILGDLGAKPYYTTPTGIKGIGAPSASSAATGQLTGSKVEACSAVIMTNQSYLPQHENLETFKAYLIGLNVKTNSYSAGNTLAAQASQIGARDRALGLSGENSLYGTMIAYLNECQNPENGTWDYKKPGDSGYDLYFQVNGLMKITGVYGTTHPIQYVDAALETAIAAITYDKKIGAAVDIYNPWFALTNIFNNLRGCGGSEGIAKVAELRQRLYETAPETLIATRDKIAICKKPDGSFSYSPTYSSATSQGCPAAVPNSKEGDVNGTVLSCSGLLSYVYSALGLSGSSTKVPLFGEVERVMFMNEVRHLKHFDKPNSNITIEAEDFESYYPGDVPDDDSRFAKKINSENGKVEIIAREDGEGNALLFKSSSTSVGDYVNIKNQSVNPAATTFIFEGDMRIDYSAKTYAVQMFMGSAYMLAINVENDQVCIYETSSATNANAIKRDLGVRIPLSQWFSLKIEYYYGNHDEVRIKVFFDGDLSDGKELKLIAVTDNYYDKNGNKLNNYSGTPSKTFNETQMFIPSDAAVEMQLDNVASYKTVDKYVPSEVAYGELKYNVDEYRDPVTYDFDNGIPEDLKVTDGAFESVPFGEGKSLSVSSPAAAATIEAAFNSVAPGGKCFSTSFVLLCENASADATVLTACLNEEGGSVTGYAIVSDGELLWIYEYNNGAVGKRIGNSGIAIGVSSEICVEYYRDQRTSIFYIDGEFLGVSASLCTGGARRVATDVTISFPKGAYELIIDDLKAEKNANSYAEAVKPEVDSVINDFENGVGSSILGAGASHAVYGGSGVIKLDSTSGASDVKIPVNDRSKIASAIVAEIQVVYNRANADGVAHNITVNDKDGNVIFGVTLVVNGDKIELYEMKRSGSPTMLLASFDKTKASTIGFEVYVDEALAYISLDNICVALTGCFPYPENIKLKPEYLTVTSGAADSVAFIDNVKIETLYQAYVKKTVNSLPNDETEGALTFDKSNDGSLPARLYKYLAGGASVKIKNLLNTVTGEYSNVAVFKTNTGYNDKIGISTDEDLSGYSCVTFETDFKMNNYSNNGDKFWFYLSRNIENASEIAYQVSFSVSGGKLYFFDRSTNKGYIEKKYYTDISNLDEWHHLKIEYFAVDNQNTRIRLSIDGEVIYVSDNYYGRTYADRTPAPRTGIKKAFFYSFADTSCELFLDNTRLYGSDATCSDTVGEK